MQFLIILGLLLHLNLLEFFLDILWNLFFQVIHKLSAMCIVINYIQNSFLLTIHMYYPSCSHHSRFFETSFERCLTEPTQARYSIAFPLICTHFINCTHDVCPEEVCSYGNQKLCLDFLTFLLWFNWKTTHRSIPFLSLENWCNFYFSICSEIHSTLKNTAHVFVCLFAELAFYSPH